MRLNCVAWIQPDVSALRLTYYLSYRALVGQSVVRTFHSTNVPVTIESVVHLVPISRGGIPFCYFMMFAEMKDHEKRLPLPNTETTITSPLTLSPETLSRA